MSLSHPYLDNVVVSQFQMPSLARTLILFQHQPYAGLLGRGTLSSGIPAQRANHSTLAPLIRHVQPLEGGHHRLRQHRPKNCRIRRTTWNNFSLKWAMSK